MWFSVSFLYVDGLPLFVAFGVRRELLICVGVASWARDHIETEVLGLVACIAGVGKRIKRLPERCLVS